MAARTTILTILFRYYKQEELTPQEVDVLQAWLAASEHNQALFDDLSNTEEWERQLAALRAVDPEPAWKLLQARLRSEQQARLLSLRRWKIAALVGGLLVVLGGGWYWWIQSMPVAHAPLGQSISIAPLTPGHPDSLVTVETGGGISVPLKEGRFESIQSDGQTVARQEKDQLTYSAPNPTATLAYNTLRTPIGKQYKVVLSDGTVVWLNAVSQLRYPVAFSGDQRIVELNGEAYFEVRADPAKPFTVIASRGAVTATGTRFVVRDYGSDNTTEAGLEEGKVTVGARGQQRVLQPGQVVSIGQQQEIQNSVFSLQQLSAWKEQKIWFKNARFEDIFRTLVRWYAIQVRFQGTIRSRFTGVLPTNRPLDQLLAILEKTDGVHFQLEGRVLTITE